MLIDVDQDETTPGLYGVSAMPTLVIADAEGTELAKSVGAPFSTPDGAIKWFDEIGGKITAYLDLNSKWNESKHSNAEIGEKLVEAAKALGKDKQILEIYDALISLAGEDKARAASLHLKAAKMLLEAWDVEAASAHVEKADKLTPAEGDGRIDLDIVRAKVLMFEEKPEEARKLADKYFEPLLAKSDARVIDLAEVIMNTADGEDDTALNKKGRDLYLKLVKGFEKHERVWELKVYAAWYGLAGDSKEAAKKELAEVAEKGDGRWKEIAKSLLEGAEKEPEEKDGDGEDSDEGEDDMG